MDLPSPQAVIEREGHPSMKTVIFVVLALTVPAIGGCTGDRSPANGPRRQPLRLGEPLAVEDKAAALNLAMPRPILKVEAPEEGAKVPALRRFPIVLRLEVAEGDRVPELVLVEVRQGKQSFGSSAALEGERLDERTYLLNTELIAPSRPGVYGLRVETVYGAFVEGEDEAARIQRVEVQGPRIRVVRP